MKSATPKNYHRMHGWMFSIIGVVFLGAAMKGFYDGGLTSTFVGNALVGVGASLRGSVTLFDPDYKQSHLPGLGMLISIAGIGVINWQYIN